MTAVDVCFRYGAAPDEGIMRGIDRLWEVYGIRRILFNEQERSIRVEYDATRLSESVVASLLRRAGMDLREQVVLA